MRHYFVELDGALQESLDDHPIWPLERDLQPMLQGLDGTSRWAVLVAALPEGVEMDRAPREDLYPADHLQVGGSAERLLVQLGRDEGEDHRLYNISLEPTATGAPETERIVHGSGDTMVRPEEVLTWEQALPLFLHYVRHDSQLPHGVWLRDFNDRQAPSVRS